ncbi:MAG: hypothetical protein A2V65_11525 [Deltaproteobacteria bacterium RBG_13_49_15]|nr:MAG: hypothetical protein A2V65_11525 [Deltaproteobacteria bacterium RBG_13_49_15]
MKIFIGTSAFCAILDRDDKNHQKSGSVWKDAIEKKHKLMTSSYILGETAALLLSRIGMEAAGIRIGI